MAQSIFQGLAKSGGVRSVVGVRSTPTGGTMTEAGIGAVMPWADRLWFLNYPDTSGQGDGLGLWSMGDDMRPTLEAETNECDTARLVFGGKLYIGRHVVDYQGNITPITGWNAAERITSYVKLSGDTNLWALTMAGSVYKVNPTTNVATVWNTRIAASTALNITGLVHGKAAWGHPTGRYIFCVFNGSSGNGRLCVYDTTQGGADAAWTNIDAGNNSWINVGGSYDMKGHIFASGHDFKSGLLWMLDGGTYSATPRKFRLPLGSEQQLETYQQEWMRLRAVETERYLLDQHGTFYQLSTILTGSDDVTADFPRIDPIARHTRTIPDFCFWNGYFVAAGNQATPQASNKYPDAGQPQSGLLLTTLDDIWSWGKPTGTGYWYRAESATGGVASDPMLARGYDKKTLHLANGTGTAVSVDVLVYLNGAQYVYDTVTVPANGYTPLVFPAGYGCDWIAVRPTTTCATFTAGVVYL